MNYLFYREVKRGSYIFSMEHKNINIVLGFKPFLISAPHAVPIYKTDENTGELVRKPREIRTRKIVKNVCAKTGAWGVYSSSNSPIEDWETVVYKKYKKIIRRLIKTQNIKLFIDIHGSKEDRPFIIDYDFILNDLHSDDKLLETLLLKNIQTHINKDAISKGFFRDINGPGYKTLTRIVRKNFNIPAIQIEINKKARLNEEKLNKIISSIYLTVKDYENTLTRV